MLKKKQKPKQLKSFVYAKLFLNNLNINKQIKNIYFSKTNSKNNYYR